VVPLSGGYFEVENASSGSVLYELGLRNGDKIKSINGEGTWDVEKTASAFGVEYLENGETEYTVTVERGGNDVDLDIEVICPQ
jgi:type II secretory pathway component PulC